MNQQTPTPWSRFTLRTVIANLREYQQADNLTPHQAFEGICEGHELMAQEAEELAAAIFTTAAPADRLTPTAAPTPGPWVVAGNTIWSDPGYVSGCFEVAKVIPHVLGGQCRTAYANALLIARAPKMDAALNRVYEFLVANYLDSDMPDILPMVRDALSTTQRK